MKGLARFPGELHRLGAAVAASKLDRNELSRLAVRAHPGASRSRAEWDGSTLHVWVTAPPVEGGANRALLEVVAAALGVRRSKVALVEGERSRQKVLEVEGLDPKRLERLRRPGAGPP